MANKKAYPNQSVGFELEGFGPGGMPPTTFVVLTGSATINGGSPITGTIVGTTIYITIPANQAIGTITLALSWTQNLNGVVSSQGPINYLVDILAQPSGSSQSYVPTSPTRQCLRLAEPDNRTVEQYLPNDADPRNPAMLAVYFYNVPYSLLRPNVANFPSAGIDVVSISYVDPSGQPGTFTFNCTLWMSNSGYVFTSADNGVQYFLAGIDGFFFDAYAQIINTRQVNMAMPLSPCANAGGFGYDTLLPNQYVPFTFVDCGVLLNSSASGAPNIV